MVRFVVGPAAEAVPDVKRKLPGRGIWITATRASIEEAVKRNVFARGFKRDVRVARDLATQTEQLIERAVLDALAMAGKAGTVVSGFSRVEGALGRDDILALIHAGDAGDDGKRKLMAALHRNRAGESRKIVVIDAFTGAQLDLALNRPNVVHGPSGRHRQAGSCQLPKSGPLRPGGGMRQGFSEARPFCCADGTHPISAAQSTSRYRANYWPWPNWIVAKSSPSASSTSPA